MCTHARTHARTHTRTKQTHKRTNTHAYAYTQVAELLDTAARTHNDAETRAFVSFVSPGREPLISQTAYAIKADFSVSGHLHARYCVSFNDWAVHKVCYWVCVCVTEYVGWMH